MLFDIKVKQILNTRELENYLKENHKVVICAGRWGPMCIPVYKAFEKIMIDENFKDIMFCVVNFDTEAAGKIRNLEECRYFRGLPFTVYFLGGKAVHATSSIQTQQQIESNIKKYLFIDKGELK